MIVICFCKTGLSNSNGIHCLTLTISTARQIRYVHLNGWISVDKRVLLWCLYCFQVGIWFPLPQEILLHVHGVYVCGEHPALQKFNWISWGNMLGRVSRKLREKKSLCNKSFCISRFRVMISFSRSLWDALFFAHFRKTTCRYAQAHSTAVILATRYEERKKHTKRFFALEYLE